MDEINIIEKQLEQAWEKLGISNDFMFGKVMQDEELCKGLLQRILPDLDIDHIEYPELQKSIKTDVDAKSIRLDVYVKDKKGTVYNIEMQTTDTKDLPKRTRYYQGVLDLQLIDKGQTYNMLKPSYIIFICSFDVFKKGRHIYTFENICKEDKNISLGDETTKIFLNTDSIMNDVSEELRVFLDYVAGKKSDDSYIKKLDEAVKKARLTKEWRHEFMTLSMRDRVNREEGKKEGKIYGAISVYRDLKLSDNEILKNIQIKYELSEDEALKYLHEA